VAQEWVKAWAYQGRAMQSFDYVYTFANQLHTEDRLLQAGVEIVVTDSPVYLQCMYALHQRMKAANELWRIAKGFEKEYPSVNFFVRRGAPTCSRGATKTRSRPATWTASSPLALTGGTSPIAASRPAKKGSKATSSGRLERCGSAGAGTPGCEMLAAACARQTAIEAARFTNRHPDTGSSSRSAPA
jgi:hypothetical protein